MGKWKLHLGMCFFINVTIDFFASVFGPQTNKSLLPKWGAIYYLKSL
jgi:hypothetical protein